MAQSSCTTSSPFTFSPPSCSTETFMAPLLHPEPQADRLSLHFCTAEGVGMWRASHLSWVAAGSDTRHFPDDQETQFTLCLSIK